MIVAMPESIFQEKDYLNMRYFYKRAYYLSFIAAELRKSRSDVEFAFDHLHANMLLPILVARVKDPKCPAIRIIPCAPEGYFPTSKLTAISNCIRQGKSEDTEGAKVPTPFYNTTLKAESQFLPYKQLLHKAAKSCAAFKDACVLGRIWLQQRGFSSNIRRGGFGHFEWAAMMALLLQGGGRKGEAVLSPSLNSAQLFKVTLQYIATANLQKKLLVIGEDPPDLETLRQTMPILYDAARGINILYKMSPWSIAMLTEQAKWSLSVLKDTPYEQFHSLFIAKANQPLQMFDFLLSIHVPASKEGFESTDCKGLIWDFSAKLYNTLKRALGERARLIHITTPEKPEWSLAPGSKLPKEKYKSLLVGIVIDPLKASSGREYGPPYENKSEAARFREFWGDKSDLWQFPDGSMVESVDWTEHAYLGFPGICEAIIRYILKLRLQLDESDLEFYGGEMSKVLPLLPSDKVGFDRAKQAFDILERDIRDLEGLPLHVKHVAPVGTDLRRTSLHTPEFNFRKPLLEPMDVVVSFEVSGKWPEDLPAIQRAKTAFLLKIGSSLEEVKEEEVRTRLGLDNAARGDGNLSFLNVIYENGASFRIRVQSDLEEALLDRQRRDQTAERHVRTRAADLLASYKRMYINLPLHNQAISTFCTRFPALSSSIRLTKHWFNSHKLSCYFKEELIELFVLQAFLKPYPWQTPSSATTGFLRTLFLLSRWDWRTEALVVDSSDELSTSQRFEINTRIQAWRKTDPNMNRLVLFVATSYDVTGLAYTQDGPSKVVATRMTTLARSVCKIVKEQGVDASFRSLFQPALRDYDVMLHLNTRVLKKLNQEEAANRRSQFKNLDDRGPMGPTAIPVPEHPTQALLRRLNGLYDSPLLFFHGGADDAIIAGLWNPELLQRRFKANMPCSLRPRKLEKKSKRRMEKAMRQAKRFADKSSSSSSSDDEAADDDEDRAFEMDRAGVLAEIARLGAGLVEGVETKDSTDSI